MWKPFMNTDTGLNKFWRGIARTSLVLKEWLKKIHM